MMARIPTDERRSVPVTQTSSPASTVSQKLPNLGRSTAIMTAGTLLSRITGIARNALLLACLGTTLLGDSYNSANTTPNMVYELVAGGVLSALLVPLFNALIHKGTRRANDGINAIVSLAFIGLIATAIIVAVASPAIMWLYFDKPSQALQRQLGSELLRMFAPQIAVYGFITLATAALNTKRKFGAAMLAPVFNNLVMIAVLSWAYRILGRLYAKDAKAVTQLQAVARDSQAKWILGFGTTVGVAAMGLVLIPALRNAKVGWHWHWEPTHPAVTELLRLSGWTMGYVAANQAAVLFVQRRAVRAEGANGGGGIMYSFAYSVLFLLPHSLFAVSIMTALQPELSIPHTAHSQHRQHPRRNRPLSCWFNRVVGAINQPVPTRQRQHRQRQPTRPPRASNGHRPPGIQRLPVVDERTESHARHQSNLHRERSRMPHQRRAGLRVLSSRMGRYRARPGLFFGLHHLGVSRIANRKQTYQRHTRAAARSVSLADRHQRCRYGHDGVVGIARHEKSLR
jgi:Lipid II flippase MurJ